MPGVYAHYRFGAAVLAAMPADIRRSVQRFRRLYDVGLHGPDLFYNFYPVGSERSLLAIKYHEQSGKAFFGSACRFVRMGRNEAASAYLYGVLCHYVLDSSLHPFISLTAEECGVSTLELETELDRYLLERDHKLPANGQKLTQHLKLTEGECETVASFYPPANGKTVTKALQSTISLTRIMMNPTGVGGAVAKAAVAMLGKPAKGLLMTHKPNPACAHLDDVLLELYEKALEEFPEYLTQIQAQLTYNANLGEAFDRTFG